MSALNASCASADQCANAFPRLDVVCVQGQCFCASGFAMDGLDCAQPTAASLGSRAALLAAIGVVCLTFARFAPVFYRAYVLRRVRKDPAGITFVLATLSLVSVAAQASSYACRGYMWSPVLENVTDAFVVASVTFLSAAIVVQGFTFYELAFAVSAKPHGFARIELAAVITVFLVGLAGALCFALAGIRAWTLLVIVLFAMLLVLALFGPLKLYISAATTMAATAGRRRPRLKKLLGAVIQELLFGNRAMRRALGLYGTDSNDDDGLDESKNSKDSREEDHGASVGVVLTRVATSFRASVRRVLPPADNPADVIVNPAPGKVNGRNIIEQTPMDENAPIKVKKFFIDSRNGKDASHMAHVRRRETALVKFLGRILRANTFLTFNVLGYIAACLAIVNTETRADESTLIRTEALCAALQSTFLALGLYQIFWFFSLKFRVRERPSMTTGATPGFSKQNSRENSRGPSRAGSFSRPGSFITNVADKGQEPDLTSLVFQVEQAAFQAREAQKRNGASVESEHDEDDVQVFSEKEDLKRDTIVEGAVDEAQAQVVLAAVVE